MLEEELPLATFTAPAGMRELCFEACDGATLRHAINMQTFHIRLANSAGRREAASLLIRKMYGWRGYAVEPPMPQEPNKITLYAETGGGSVGTMSLVPGRRGRAAGRRQFPRQARPAARGRPSPVRTVAPGDRQGRDQARVRGPDPHLLPVCAQRARLLSDYVIEVNPRHVMFYERMLGFADFGGERASARGSAPRPCCCACRCRYGRTDSRAGADGWNSTARSAPSIPTFFRSGTSRASPRACWSADRP